MNTKTQIHEPICSKHWFNELFYHIQKLYRFTYSLPFYKVGKKTHPDLTYLFYEMAAGTYIRLNKDKSHTRNLTVPLVLNERLLAL